MKLANIICFLMPFVISTFNAQVFVTVFISNTLAQLIAYGNIGLLIAGIFLNIKKIGQFSETAKLWGIFYVVYYVFAIIASAYHDNPAQVAKSIIPTIYFFAFYIYLSIPENRKLFQKVATAAFVLSSLLCIYLFKINFSIDHGGIYQYRIDRAGGVFGDANNAALVAILSFIFLFKNYNPVEKWKKIVKLSILAAMLYCLFLTFSTTGFFVFAISMVMLNHKFFTPKRIFLVAILLPVFYIAMINLNTLTSGINLTEHQRFKINNIVNLLTLKTDEVDSSGRNELLANLLEYVYESPYMGNGVDFAIGQRGHNTIVGVWADAGILALIIFLYLLFTYFKNAWKAPPEIRFFTIPILIAMCIFMLSLQSVINQPYLVALFVYLGYLIDVKSNPYKYRYPKTVANVI
jgi:O-antigen ligase